jgi:hypothetical protein
MKIVENTKTIKFFTLFPFFKLSMLDTTFGAVGAGTEATSRYGSGSLFEVQSKSKK